MKKYLESLQEGVKIGDGEANVVTAGKMAGVSSGWSGAVRAFWKLRVGISFYEMKSKRSRQTQPYHLKFSEIRGFYFLKAKYLRTK